MCASFAPPAPPAPNAPGAPPAPGVSDDGVFYAFVNEYIGNPRRVLQAGLNNYLAANPNVRQVPISELAPGEDLVLYAHGNKDTFAKKTPNELHDWLISQSIPDGCRTIFLKGCNSADVAKALQALFTNVPGYQGVIVRGSSGTARTTRFGQSVAAGDPRREALFKLTKARRKKRLATDEEVQNASDNRFKPYSTSTGTTRSGTHFS